MTNPHPIPTYPHRGRVGQTIDRCISSTNIRTFGAATDSFNPFTGNVALLHHARPLERATSHYCTTGSRGLFTAYLDLLVLRFSVDCSSAASLYILFHHHVYIFTYVSVAVRKTCLFVPRTCCDSSTCSRTTQKRLHTSSKAI